MKSFNKLIDELDFMPKFYEEQKLFKQGYQTIGAIDEAGRGPLAGPVVAACVISRRDLKIKSKKWQGIKDSKKLSAKKREEFYELILEEYTDIGVGVCQHQTIDRINILQATFLAMKKAVSALKKKPEFILLDGRWQIPNFSIKQRAVVRGDELIFSIAAASIVAKVTRDRMMAKFSKRYPGYGFDQNKGYGTWQHRQSLKKYGLCSIHRKSFSPIKHYFNKFS